MLRRLRPTFDRLGRRDPPSSFGFLETEPMMAYMHIAAPYYYSPYHGLQRGPGSAALVVRPTPPLQTLMHVVPPLVWDGSGGLRPFEPGVPGA